MSKYGFKKGDLLKWTDYIKGRSEVGLFLGDAIPKGSPIHRLSMGDIVVLVGDEQVIWDGWQCDKLDKGEWTCK